MPGSVLSTQHPSVNKTAPGPVLTQLPFSRRKQEMQLLGFGDPQSHQGGRETAQYRECGGPRQGVGAGREPWAEGEGQARPDVVASLVLSRACPLGL